MAARNQATRVSRRSSLLRGPPFAAMIGPGTPRLLETISKVNAPIRDTDVLIVGAGPTGLVLALWLTRLGVRVRIVDRTAEPGTTSRAIAVQARTLELYRQTGLADAVVERGRKAVAVNLWVAGKKAARAVFGDIGTGLSP